MRDVRDSTPEPEISIEDSRYRLQMISVSHRGASFQVPLFSQFLQRERVAKECSVCTEEIYDVDIGSLERWTADCAAIEGDWMWQVLAFPAMLMIDCGHAIDFCTSCLQRHIDTQISQHGRSRCDRIPCLSAECDRSLTYNEIKLYAKAETFDR